MINKVKKLVSNIQQVEFELDEMGQENIEVGMEKVNHVFELAKVALGFEGIYMSAKMHGTPIEHREHFQDNSGGMLKGLLISSMLENSEKTGMGEVSEYKEVFLLEDGSLKVFYVIHKWPIDRKNSLHHEVTRGELDFYQREFQFDIVIRCIMQELERRQLELNCKKYCMRERLDKVRSMEAS